MVAHAAATHRSGSAPPNSSPPTAASRQLFAPQRLCAPGGAERLREKRRSDAAATPLRSLLRFTPPHCNKYDSYSRARRQGFAEIILETAHALEIVFSTRASVLYAHAFHQATAPRSTVHKNIFCAIRHDGEISTRSRAVGSRGSTPEMQTFGRSRWTGLAIVRVTSSGLRCSTTERILRFSLRI
jgi:hypothetical protein